MLIKGIQTALAAVYPARCLTCGSVVDSDFGLCGPCWRDTSFLGGAVCDGCGVPLLMSDDPDMLMCDACLVQPRPWVQGRAAVLYAKTGRKLVLALKHGDRQEIAKPAALWMAHALGQLVPKNALVVPIPLHWMRMIKRRYNQSALLAQALARQMSLACGPDILQRPKATKTLDGLGRVARQEMLQDAICVNPKLRHRIVARPVLLVDDVMTSGATLSAATAALQQAGAGPVRVVTLARVAKDA